MSFHGRHGGSKGRSLSWLNSALWDTLSATLPGAFLEVRAPEGPSYRPGRTQVVKDETGGQVPAVHTPPSGPVRIDAEERTDGGMSSSAGLAEEIICGGGTPVMESRVDMFQAELSKRRIRLTELQKLAAQGIPDQGSIRAITWKLLLGYLPKNQAEWDKELVAKRARYAQFRQELIINPSEALRRVEEGEGSAGTSADADAGTEETVERQTLATGDHPLNDTGTSVWHQFFKDTEVAQQIDRDVQRTHPDMHFFNGINEASAVNQDALRRILFIFAKLNPGIRYVQGMNEVLAPLFWIFRNDPETQSVEDAEADSFFCFVELLSEFRDHFCQQLDNSEVGIRSTIARMSALLRRHDEELWRHLDQISKVNPQFYAFRWITLLLTQEFNFPDILRLWDSLLSNPDGPMEILLRVCCAMLICMRDRLLAGDFITNLKLLQNYPSSDINSILRVADRLKP